ncbi:MAG TPA: HPF/RaiA family ribosome-associated protein [Humisphaera sp.]
MTIEIYGIGHAPTEALREYVSRRVESAVGRFSRRVRRVTVRVLDENGPRGGVDMVCRIEAVLGSVGPVVVERRDADGHAAIDAATTRLKQVVADRLAQARDVRRRGAKQPGFGFGRRLAFG